MTNEFITRFTFQENNSSQNTYYNNIEKQKLVSFVTTSNKTMSAIAEDEKSFSEIFACFDKQTLNLCQIMNWPITNKLYSYVLKKVRLKQIQSLYFGTSYSHVSSSINQFCTKMWKHKCC